MDDTDKIKQRFELLKIARDLLNEDYINRRAEDHNKWVAENEESWRTRRRNIPYPPFAQYPTDDEIVRAATNLYNFIYSTDNKTINNDISSSILKEQPPSTKGFEQGDDVFPKSTLPIETKSENVQEKEITSEPITVIEEISVVDKEKVPTLEEIKELNAVVASKSFLPGWVRRSK
jgi:hypothetical protein